jgi:hypothetical protein
MDWWLAVATFWFSLAISGCVVLLVSYYNTKRAERVQVIEADLPPLNQDIQDELDKEIRKQER